MVLAKGSRSVANIIQFNICFGFSEFSSVLFPSLFLQLFAVLVTKGKVYLAWTLYVINSFVWRLVHLQSVSHYYFTRISLCRGNQFDEGILCSVFTSRDLGKWGPREVVLAIVASESALNLLQYRC